jgi:hypothetical protein
MYAVGSTGTTVKDRRAIIGRKLILSTGIYGWIGEGNQP